MPSKRDAYNFLLGLQERLVAALPPPGIVRQQMTEFKELNTTGHNIAENQFLFHFIVGPLSQHLQKMGGLDAAQARQSLLCEYHKMIPTLSSGNPRRGGAYPFNKSFSRSAAAVYEAWASTAKRTYPLNQSYPDLALRNPCPFKIVFDAKYFVGDSPAAAVKALVEGVHEVAYYRGLPRLAPLTSNDPGWDYDYGCLLAFDASRDGTLAAAWQGVACKTAFWQDGNIFVMILGGAVNTDGPNTKVS